MHIIRMILFCFWNVIQSILLFRSTWRAVPRGIDFGHKSNLRTPNYCILLFYWIPVTGLTWSIIQAPVQHLRGGGTDDHYMTHPFEWNNIQNENITHPFQWLHTITIYTTSTSIWSKSAWPIPWKRENWITYT